MSKIETVINKIKENGYWRVVLEPTTSVDWKGRVSHSADLKNILTENQVSLRGCSYPFYPSYEFLTDEKALIGKSTEENRIDCFIYESHYGEVCSLFMSGQFVQLINLTEDLLHMTNDSWIPGYMKNIKQGSSLEFVWTTSRITEMFLFFKNLVSSVNYGDKVHITISLENTEDRKIILIDDSRIGLHGTYKTGAARIKFVDDDFEVEDIKSNCLEIAKNKIVDLFRYFEWESPPVQVIESDQEKLINRRL